MQPERALPRSAGQLRQEDEGQEVEICASPGGDLRQLRAQRALGQGVVVLRADGLDALAVQAVALPRQPQLVRGDEPLKLVGGQISAQSLARAQLPEPGEQFILPLDIPRRAGVRDVVSVLPAPGERERKREGEQYRG